MNPGHVSVPWNKLLLKTFQGRAVQLIIGSITLGGLISFATGIIQFGSNVTSRSENVESHLQKLIGNADNGFSRMQLEEILNLMCDSFLALCFQQLLTRNLSECQKLKSTDVENKELIMLCHKRVAHRVF